MFASRALKFSMRICILVGRPCYFTPLQETRTLSTEGTKGPAWSPFPTYRWAEGGRASSFLRATPQDREGEDSPDRQAPGAQPAALPADLPQARAAAQFPRAVQAS